MIEVHDLTKRYGKKLAVDHLTFTVSPGQVTGFLGPNGAGKSTTMRLILGLDRPGEGTATISGRSYPIRATVTQALESEGIRGEKEKIGIGAGAGAVIGAILGGVKGALAGVLIGGGGTIAATEGKDVTLPAGTVLRVRFDQPLQIR